VTVIDRRSPSHQARSGHDGLFVPKPSFRHRFLLPMYSSIMAVIVAPIAMHNTGSSLAILPILFVIVLLAAGYFAGREYVNRRLNRRNWK
jgi:uncharacterized membrane protein